VKLLLGLDGPPSPHDAADALAVALCHVHSAYGAIADAVARTPDGPRGAASPKLTSWRAYRP